MTRLEEMDRKLEQSHIEVMAAINGENYNPDWHRRKTADGKNYNGGKYDNPYAEDNYKKAGTFLFFCAVFVLGFMR